MSKKDKALKLALDALEHGLVNTNPVLNYDGRIISKAITAIREALAEQPAQPYPNNFIDALKYDVAKRDSEAQQQEPVAWITKNGKGWLRWHKPEDSEKNKDSIPLYTSPPASKPWVGLSTDEIYDMYNEPRSDAEMVEFALSIEAKLREKNA